MEIEAKGKEKVDWYQIYDLIAAQEYGKLMEIVKDVKDAEALQNIIRVICESSGKVDEE